MDSDEFMTEQNQTFITGGTATGQVGAGEERPADEEQAASEVPQEQKTVSEVPEQKVATDLPEDEKAVR